MKWIIEHYPGDGYPTTGAYPVNPQKPAAVLRENGVLWFALPAVEGTAWEICHYDGRESIAHRRCIGPGGEPGYIDDRGFHPWPVGTVVVEAASALEALQAYLKPQRRREP